MIFIIRRTVHLHYFIICEQYYFNVYVQLHVNFYILFKNLCMKFNPWIMNNVKTL